MAASRAPSAWELSRQRRASRPPPSVIAQPDTGPQQSTTQDSELYLFDLLLSPVNSIPVSFLSETPNLAYCP